MVNLYPSSPNKTTVLCEYPSLGLIDEDVSKYKFPYCFKLCYKDVALLAIRIFQDRETDDLRVYTVFLKRTPLGKKESIPLKADRLKNNNDIDTLVSICDVPQIDIHLSYRSLPILRIDLNWYKRHKPRDIEFDVPLLYC